MCVGMYGCVCAGGGFWRLTLYVACKGWFPEVHLNELDTAEDLVHQSDALVRDRHTPLPEIGRQARGQHLQEKIKIKPAHEYWLCCSGFPACSKFVCNKSTIKMKYIGLSLA